MKKAVTIEALTACAAKMGHNANDARGIIEQNFTYILKHHPNASKKEMVHIAVVIYK